MCPSEATLLLATSSTVQDIEKVNEHLRSLSQVDAASLPFVSIPEGDAICSLSAIRAGVLHMPSSVLLTRGPDEEDEELYVPAFAFLIEKKAPNGDLMRFLFDLGLRRIEEFTHPRYQHLCNIWRADAKKGVDTILPDSLGIPLSSIDAILLGHCHFDHSGNIAAFPPSVDLVLGPDSDPLDVLAEKLDVPLKALQDRHVRYLSRTGDKWVDVGAFKGLDYFGDGSLYLLDTPGHINGHVSALVRTSASPSTYHLLASDTAHHIALMTPSKTRPRVAFFPQGGPERQRLQCMHDDLATAYLSMGKAERMDAEENINVCLGHDRTMDFAFGAPKDSQEPGIDWVKLEGTREELRRFKARQRVTFK